MLLAESTAQENLDELEVPGADVCRRVIQVLLTAVCNYSCVAQNAKPAGDNTRVPHNDKKEMD